MARESVYLLNIEDISVKLNNLKFENKALEIVTARSRGWELLLFSELLDEEIIFSKIALSDDSFVKQKVMLKVNEVKKYDDISKLITSLMADMELALGFSEEFQRFEPSKHPDAFGLVGMQGNPAILKILSKKVGALHYDIGIKINEKKYELIFLSEFFSRNLNNSIDKDKLARMVLLKGTEFVVSAERNLLLWIEGFSRYIRGQVEADINGRPSPNKLTVVAPDTEELNAVIQAAMIYFKSEHEVIAGDLSIANKSTQNMDENEVEGLTSIKEILVWLSSKSVVTLTEMRNVLLPLDLFPGAVIDDINEKALNETGEVALIENGSEIVINQEVLQQVSDGWITQYS